nr:hypothetical protein [Streptomyces griseocarneus]
MQRGRPAAGEPGGLLLVERAGGHGGGDLADGVPDDRARLEAVAAPHLGEAELDGEGERLDVGRRPGAAGLERLAGRPAELVAEDVRQRVDLCRERRFARQQSASHSGPLGAVPGEHPHDLALVAGRGPRRGDAGAGTARGEVAQPLGQAPGGVRDESRPLRQVRAAQGEGVPDRGRRDAGVGVQPVGDGVRQGAQPGLRRGGQGNTAGVRTGAPVSSGVRPPGLSSPAGLSSPVGPNSPVGPSSRMTWAIVPPTP